MNASDPFAMLLELFPDVAGEPRRRGRGAKSLAIEQAAARILAEIQPATVRAVCYRLFVERLIPSMRKSCTDSVSRILVRAREEGTVPWEHVVDETRRVEQAPSWDDPAELWSAAQRQYRKDLWNDQDVHLEVWSEKGTVRGTLGPVLDEFGVGFRVLHGYSSATVVQDIAAMSARLSKPFIALYAGDWDPSGLHMSEVDLPRRLTEYGGRVRLSRIALTEADIGADLPSFDAASKRKDPRYAWFKAHHGTRCWELDAMSPVALRERVRDAIQQYIDTDRWNRAIEVEAVERASMLDFLADWNAMKAEAN